MKDDVIRAFSHRCNATKRLMFLTVLHTLNIETKILRTSSQKTDSPQLPSHAESSKLTKLTLGCWRCNRTSTLLHHCVTLEPHARTIPHAHTLSHRQPGHTAGLCSVSKIKKAKSRATDAKEIKEKTHSHSWYSTEGHAVCSYCIPVSGWTRQSY